MRGFVQNAAPAAGMPNRHWRAFVQSREYAVLENEHRSGESQRTWWKR